MRWWASDEDDFMPSVCPTTGVNLLFFFIENIKGTFFSSFSLHCIIYYFPLVMPPVELLSWCLCSCSLTHFAFPIPFFRIRVFLCKTPYLTNSAHLLWLNETPSP